MSAPRPARPSLRPDLELLVGEMGERLGRFDAALRDLAAGEGAPPGFDPDTYLTPHGPRIRPLLVLLSAQVAAESEGAGTPPGDAATEHVAVAVELLHVAVHLHDVALGREEGRRRRAARRILGGAMGLLGANHLTLRALELARLTPAPEIVGDLLEALREAAVCHAMAHGLRGRLASAEECLTLAEGHHGAVFSFACRSGARLGGGERALTTALGRYGRHTGVAWAMAEDLATLSLEGDDLTRALGDRALLGRPLLPLCMASARDPEIAATWTRFRRNTNAEGAADLAAQVKRTGAFSEGRRRLVLESWTARQALGGLPPSPARAALDRLAVALVS